MKKLVVRGHDRDLQVVVGGEVGPVRVVQHHVVVRDFEEGIDAGAEAPDPVAEGKGRACLRRGRVGVRLHPGLRPVSRLAVRFGDGRVVLPTRRSARAQGTE